jgi:hypothetical protein
MPNKNAAASTATVSSRPIAETPDLTKAIAQTSENQDVSLTLFVKKQLALGPLKTRNKKAVHIVTMRKCAGKTIIRDESIRHQRLNGPER